MKEYSFIFKSSTDNVTINFNEISVEDSINRFIGFLRSAGHNDDVIKCAAQDVLNGKWVKSFSNISTLQTQLNSVGHYNTLNTLSIIPTMTALTTDQLKPLTTCSYSTPI